MKKRFLAVLAVMMVLVMSTSTVFAAPSPSALQADVLAEAATSDEGQLEALSQETVAKLGDVTAKAVAAVKEAVSKLAADQGASILGALGIKEGYSSLFAEKNTIKLSDLAAPAPEAVEEEEEIEAEVVSAFDFIPGEELVEELQMNGSVEVTFECEVTAEDDVLLFHEASEDDWEAILPEEVGDGFVVAEFTGFSPIAIVKLTSASEAPVDEPSVGLTPAQPDDGTATLGAATADAPSPKTGETIAWIALVAVIALAGVVVCTRKYRLNK